MRQPGFNFHLIVLLGLVGWTLGLSSCVYFNTFYNAQKYFKEGVKENKDNDTGRPKTGNYQKAIDSAARVLEYYPKSQYVDDALLIMGKAYYEIQSYSRAKRKFDELLTNYPQSELKDEAQLWLGKTLIAMGQAEQGVTLLTNLWSAEATEQIRLESQRRLADYHFEKKNYRQALLEYEKILGQSQDQRQRADVWFSVGECRLALEEYQEAEQAYLQVLTEKPSRKREFDAIFKRSATQQKQGQLEAALEICNSLLKKEIYFKYIEQVYLAKAEILIELERITEAEELLKRILELYPRTETSAKASYLLGTIYLEELHDFKNAEEYLLRVPTERPQSEFAQPAQKKVTDLRFLKDLNRQLDSLRADLDTLQTLLTWIAEHPGEALPQAQPDTTLSLSAYDSLRLLGEAGQPDSLQRPQARSRRRVEREIEPRTGLPPGMEQSFPGQMPEMSGVLSSEEPGKEIPIRLAPLPSDSAAIVFRVEKDQEEVAKARYRLAEHLWRQFDDADTAQTLFSELRQLTEYPDVAARSHLALYELLRLASPDSVGPDSLLWQIHEKFPGSDFDRWVRPKLGLEPLPVAVDSAELRFTEAEQLWMDEAQPEQAVRRYLEIADEFDSTEWGPRALFAAGWLEEFVLNNSEAATACYDSVVSRFPHSPLAAKAQRKVTPLPEAPDTTLVTPDSALLAAGEEIVAPVPTGSGAPQLIGGDQALEDYIHKNHLYPPVALEAEISGQVVVTFIVEINGRPKDFNLAQEDPPGFDFGAMAIQALQAMRFRPGYENDQYTELPMTQLVRFTP